MAITVIFFISTPLKRPKIGSDSGKQGFMYQISAQKNDLKISRNIAASHITADSIYEAEDLFLKVTKILLLNIYYTLSLPLDAYHIIK